MEYMNELNRNSSELSKNEHCYLEGKKERAKERMKARMKASRKDERTK